MSWLFFRSNKPNTVDFKDVATVAQNNIAAINATAAATRALALAAQEERQRKELADAFKANSGKGINSIEYAPEEAIHPTIVSELKAIGYTFAPGTKAVEPHVVDGNKVDFPDVPCSIITLPAPAAK